MAAMQSRAVGHIPFDGLPNTRDLGYLKTTTGKAIASRKLLRSGALHGASEADLVKLQDEYDVHTVIDLRTHEEKEKQPDPHKKMPEVAFVEAPILGFSATGITRENGLMGMLKTLGNLKAHPKQLMIDLYPSMLLGETGIHGYTNFFEALVNNDEGAVLWHCSAGKDRAGLAAVLLLHVLGVSKEDILADYLATNQFLEGRADELKELIPHVLQTEDILSSLKIFNSTDEEFLNAGIEGVEKKYGSLDGYLEQALGIDESKKERLCSLYLA